jgi:hypothetical protein
MKTDVAAFPRNLRRFFRNRKSASLPTSVDLLFMHTTREQHPIASGELTLEGVLHFPSPSGTHPAVAICHPHPRFGGSMENNVVIALTDALCDAGVAVLRFNFRGVGGSEGAFDRGAGEVDDAIAAVESLSIHPRVLPGRIGIVGYSFGAWMALEACTRATTPVAVASISCPMQPFNRLSSVEMLQPKLLVLGDSDHNFPVEQFRFIATRFRGTKRAEIISEADHFFRGRESAVCSLVVDFFKERLLDGRA